MPAPDEGLDLLKALADNPLLRYAPDERPEAGIPFDLQSAYRPSGDQPQAIAELIEGVRTGARDRRRPAPWRAPERDRSDRADAGRSGSAGGLRRATTGAVARRPMISRTGLRDGVRALEVRAPRL